MAKTLDPNLASILDSIRATVGGERVPTAAFEPEPEAEDRSEATPEPVDEGGSKPARPRKAPAAPPAVAIPAGQRSVEEFLAELIRPQVDAWLKAHLPELIQKMAADEIARLTGRR
jgi:cell pole-organizing protein PopZ